MGQPPKTPIKRAQVVKAPKFQPHHVFYRVPVLEALKRGRREELQTLIEGAEGLKAEFGSLDKVISTLKDAAARAGK